MEARELDPHGHLSFFIHGMPCLRSKLMINDLGNKGLTVVQDTPLVADLDSAEPPLGAVTPNQGANNRDDALHGDLTEEVMTRFQRLPGNT